MRSFGPVRALKIIGRQLVGLAMLLAMVVAVLPLPLASRPRSDQKDRSIPFPCQDRPCGCHSAEQCRKKCCCFTAAQKLAWAARNGVDAATVVNVMEGSTAPSHKSCCSSSGKTSGKLASNRSVPQKARGRGKTKIVIGIAARSCQGVEQSPTGMPAFVIPATLTFKAYLEATGEDVRIAHTALPDRNLEPPIPPPRIIAA